MPVTPHYNWALPTVGGNQDSWGTVLNEAFGITGGPTDNIDADLFAVDDALNNATTGVKKLAQDALPKAGGQMTGRLDGKTGTIAYIVLPDLAPSTVMSCDCSAYNWFKARATGAVAVAFANVPNVAGQGVAILVQLDRCPVAPTWPNGAGTIGDPKVLWPGGVAPTTFSSLGVDTYALLTLNGGATWFASKVQEDVR